MEPVVTICLGILGASMGSFAVAQVWRLRALQLVEDKRAGERVDSRELRRLQPLRRKVSEDRSECLSCHHQLAWYDLIPVYSWLSLAGKCRYCHAPIGSTEIIAEVGLGLVFALSFLFWPHVLTEPWRIVQFAVWLAACTVMAILFVYDAKWYLLPLRTNVILIVLGAVYALIQLGAANWQVESMLSLGFGIALLGGLYYLFSLFGWSGMGDSILGCGLALFLGEWQLAFLTLFLANLLGSLVIIPIGLRGKLHRSMQIPFGPFLIIACVASVLWGHQLWTFFISFVSLLSMPLMVY